MDAAAIVSRIKDEGSFDVSDATALGWGNEAYQEAVAKAGWREQVVASVGPTVTGQSRYAIDDGIVELRSLRVGGTRYTQAKSVEEMWDLRSGESRFSAGGRSADGAFAEGFDATDTRYVELWPTPGTSGDAIEALVTTRPTELSLGPPATTPIIPVDLHPMLVVGGTAIGLERWSERPDLAAPLWVRFHGQDGHGGAIEDLRRRANARVGGSRAQRMPVYGVDFG